MALLPNVARRRRQPELMDEPGLAADQHRAALAGLRRINRVSRSASVLGQAIRRFAQREKRESLTVLDVASGGGDVTISLEHWARRRGLPLDITGVDISPTAIEHAQRMADSAGCTAKFRRLDVLNEPFPGRYDVVISSLFLRHLDPPEVKILLEKMASAAGHLVLVSDLRRSTAGWLLAQLACRSLSRSHVVHVDGPRSVEGAFTIAEMASLCREANLTDCEIRRCWPCRFLLQYEKTAPHPRPSP